MNNNLPLAQSVLQVFVARTEMVDPDRSVRENQFRRSLFSLRRRLMFFKPGIVPPREANRRALSRSISALRASRIRAVFSATPVNSWAVRTRSSSRAIVVRIEVSNASIIASNDDLIYALIFGPQRETCHALHDRTACALKSSFDGWAIRLVLPPRRRASRNREGHREARTIHREASNTHSPDDPV